MKSSFQLKLMSHFEFLFTIPRIVAQKVHLWLPVSVIGKEVMGTA
jgi:hypothetical protein